MLSLLAKETMGNTTLNIKKLNAQIIKFGNKKKMKRSEAWDKAHRKEWKEKQKM